MRRWLILCALVLALCPMARAEGERALRRGVNLGNMLDAPAEGAWGQVFEDDYAARIADAGFDHVRLPVMFSIYAPDAPPYALAPDVLDRCDHIIKTCQDEGLCVILDMHNFTELSEDPARYQDKFLALWAQIAQRYKDAPDSLVFELCNEPGMDKRAWNELQRTALSVVRETNPSRWVMVTGSGWQGAADLYSLELPKDDRRLIGTFHMYLPFEFTHQGADWVGPETEAWLGTRWDETVFDEAEILQQMALGIDWARREDRPLHMGEFGAYEKADFASRVRWTRFSRERAEAAGFSWSYWEFCSAFGVYDPEAGAYRPELLQALLG